MPKNKLFDEDSEEEVTIKTENEYAKRYDAWREKEEKYKLEQKYGSKALNSDASISSDSEDESDEPLEVSEETETQFLKTLALLKTKDPRIYDPGYKFFDEKVEKEKEKEDKKQKVVFTDSDDDDDDDDNSGNIFSIEKKAEIDEEKLEHHKDGKLKNYLLGKEEHIEEDVEKELAPLKALWSDPKLNEGEAFLRDYILNKRYLEEGDAGPAGDRLRDDADLEADEEIVEEQGKFERAYNFRFEEPDDEYLKRFPRTMQYIRPKDDRRSRRRADLRTRKEAEKRNKMEEIARLKALKLKELHEKIAKLKEVTGNQDLAFNDEDIEGEFDPEEHDRRMRAIFDDQYYGETDHTKPVFPDLDEELEIENWEKYEGEFGDGEKVEGAEDGGEDAHCEDEDFNMDADYDPKKARENLLEELKRGMEKKRRNRKKKSKLAQLLQEEKPKFVPEAERSYAKFMEEYYKMDCEDVIGGDLPTRFKYREVMPNDYGLSIEEILLADDKELTQWVPLKKLVKHRPLAAERGDLNTYASKAADLQLKKRILPSLFKQLPQEPELVVPVQGSRKKKKKKKVKCHNDNKQVENVKENGIENDDDNLDVKQKNRKSKDVLNNSENEENTTNTEEVNGVEEITANAEVKSKKKKKNKVRLHKSTEVVVENENTETVQEEKKNKHKNDFFVEVLSKDEEPSTSSVQSALSKEKTTLEKPEPQGGKLKRKIDRNQEASEVPKKKTKSNQANVNKFNKNKNKTNKKNKKGNQDTKSENPLNKLSDERLKAYGLNPKKYRGFLKYKKF